MSMRRRASLAGFEMTSNEKPATGDSFRRRMSLASLGSRKYGRSFDSYSEDGVRGKRRGNEKVIVRHVPIVLEGNDSDSEIKIEKTRNINISDNKSQLSFSKFSRAWNIPDDLSSLSSISSDNSLEGLNRLDQKEEVVKAWMTRNGDKRSIGQNENWVERDRANKIQKEGDLNMGSELRRKPFSDISQNKEISNQIKATRKPLLPEPQYLNKTGTFGSSNCPMHKQGQSNFEREGKDIRTDIASLPLNAPSLIRGNSMKIKKANTPKSASTVDKGRPKHVTSIPMISAKENTGAERTELKKFNRGPGQWSFKGSRFKIKNDAKNGNENKTEQNQPKSQINKPTFQRSWSFRKPSSSGKALSTISNFQGPTRLSLSRTPDMEYMMQTGVVSKNEQNIPLKKYSSQTDLNFESRSNLEKVRMMPSVSTSSIPAEVSKEFEQVNRSKPPCVGILKTPGKRKISSSNRVEFLNNVREKEIPGRHA